MNKKHFHIAILFFFFSMGLMAQETKNNAAMEGLSIYPNPTSGDKIYITTKSNIEKEATIFDVLGKKVLQATSYNREINISTLSPGVYIIKIKEGDYTATRKLIVK